MTAPGCAACADTGHVCENHPDRAWGPMCCEAATYGATLCEHGACGCGAGMPCPNCCTPPAADGTSSIADAFTPRPH